MAWIARGTQKPPLGAQVNVAHPFGQQLVMMFAAQEIAPIATGEPTTPFVWLRDQRTAVTRFGSAAFVNASNLEGSCLSFVADDSRIDMVGPTWLPTTGVTVACVVRHGASQFARIVGDAGAGNLELYLPYVDNVVYWDFGGTGSPNRLSKSGLTFSTVVPTRYVATAGAAGSAIWQNGVKVASQSTAISRSTAATETLRINDDRASAGELNYIAVYATQWSDELCRWWSAEPYAHLYAPRLRSLVVGGVSSGPAVKPTWYYHQQWRQAS